MKTLHEFNHAVAIWLAKATKILQTVVPDQTLDTETQPTSKFIRVIHVGGQRSVWAFIAIKDGSNKAIGEWKQGDVMYPASWKAPAKHARGNIFDADGGTSRLKWTGPETLR